MKNKTWLYAGLLAFAFACGKSNTPNLRVDVTLRISENGLAGKNELGTSEIMGERYVKYGICVRFDEGKKLNIYLDYFRDLSHEEKNTLAGEWKIYIDGYLFKIVHLNTNSIKLNPDFQHYSHPDRDNKKYKAFFIAEGLNWKPQEAKLYTITLIKRS